MIECGGQAVKRILVHMCCGPCSIYPLRIILGRNAEVWGFFHNPNIHPLSEFRKRLDAVKRLASLMDLPVLFDETYRPGEFIRAVRSSTSTERGKIPPFGKRCVRCYSSRLEATARAASTGGFDAFTTSLLYSRYQDHEGIKRLGRELAERYGLEFIYHDFREGWYEAIGESREMGLYRQKYCGCIYSRIEREEEKRLKKLEKLKKREKSVC